MPRVIRAMSVTYQPYAECIEEGCGWNASASPASRDFAKNHVKATGHEVKVIKETVDLYKPEN